MRVANPPVLFLGAGLRQASLGSLHRKDNFPAEEVNRHVSASYDIEGVELEIPFVREVEGDVGINGNERRQVGIQRHKRFA